MVNNMSIVVVKESNWKIKSSRSKTKRERENEIGMGSAGSKRRRREFLMTGKITKWVYK